VRRIEAYEKIGKRRFAGARGPGNPNDTAGFNDQFELPHTAGCPGFSSRIVKKRDLVKYDGAIGKDDCCIWANSRCRFSSREIGFELADLLIGRQSLRDVLHVELELYSRTIHTREYQEERDQHRWRDIENDNAKGAKDLKAEGREDRTGTKAEGREGRDGNMKAEGREDRKGNMNAETKGAEGRSQTVGQAGAGAKLSTEQRTKISTVIKEQNIRPVTNVNFAISVGTRVPREVSFHPLPAEIVTIYPDWRGYEMFLVNDQIIVVNPRTLEIVAVLDV
jgi:hypothetical protein